MTHGSCPCRVRHAAQGCQPWLAGFGAIFVGLHEVCMHGRKHAACQNTWYSCCMNALQHCQSTLEICTFLALHGGSALVHHLAFLSPSLHISGCTSAFTKFMHFLLASSGTGSIANAHSHACSDGTFGMNIWHVRQVSYGPRAHLAIMCASLLQLLSLTVDLNMRTHVAWTWTFPCIIPCVRHPTHVCSLSACAMSHSMYIQRMTELRCLQQHGCQHGLRDA